MIEITFDGKRNLEIAERYCAGSCWRNLWAGRSGVGMLEPVIPYGQRGYRIIPDKAGLVSVHGVKERDLYIVLELLHRMGISGLACITNDDEFRTTKPFCVFMPI